MSTIDIEKTKIEVNVGDPWKRTPHLTADDTDLDGPLVLYIPTSNGQWVMMAVRTVHDAIIIVKGHRKP